MSEQLTETKESGNGATAYLADEVAQLRARTVELEQKLRVQSVHNAGLLAEIKTVVREQLEPSSRILGMGLNDGELSARAAEEICTLAERCSDSGDFDDEVRKRLIKDWFEEGHIDSSGGSREAIKEAISLCEGAHAAAEEASGSFSTLSSMAQDGEYEAQSAGEKMEEAIAALQPYVD